MESGTESGLILVAERSASALYLRGNCTPAGDTAGGYGIPKRIPLCFRICRRFDGPIVTSDIGVTRDRCATLALTEGVVKHFNAGLGNVDRPCPPG